MKINALRLYVAWKKICDAVRSGLTHFNFIIRVIGRKNAIFPHRVENEEDEKRLFIVYCSTKSNVKWNFVMSRSFFL